MCKLAKKIKKSRLNFHGARLHAYERWLVPCTIEARVTNFPTHTTQLSTGNKLAILTINGGVDFIMHVCMHAGPCKIHGQGWC